MLITSVIIIIIIHQSASSINRRSAITIISVTKQAQLCVAIISVVLIIIHQSSSIIHRRSSITIISVLVVSNVENNSQGTGTVNDFHRGNAIDNGSDTCSTIVIMVVTLTMSIISTTSPS